MFIGKIHAEAETPTLWPSNMKSQLFGKRPWCWERLKAGEKEPTEDKMAGWHHWLNGHEFEQAPEDGKGQGNLACCSPWGHKESDVTEWLNNNKKICKNAWVNLLSILNYQLTSQEVIYYHINSVYTQGFVTEKGEKKNLKKWLETTKEIWYH